MSTRDCKRRLVQNSRYIAMALAEGQVEIRERLNKENITRISLAPSNEVRDMILMDDNEIVLILTKQSK